MKCNNSNITGKNHRSYTQNKKSYNVSFCLVYASDQDYSRSTLLLNWNLDSPTLQFSLPALLMKDFKDEHVLTLIGVMMEEDFSPLVVLPFMKHGDLLTFVRNPDNK